MFNQKIYPRERCDSNKCFVLLWTFLYEKANHLSLNSHFVSLLKLLMSAENKLNRKHGHTEKVGTLSKIQKKLDNFFSKNLSSKEIMSLEPFAFKGFLTNTMTKNPATVSHLKLKQTESPTLKSMTQSLPSRINQDEFSKSNTAPQSAGTGVHDKNTKENLNNKVNQKELPQLIANIQPLHSN